MSTSANHDSSTSLVAQLYKNKQFNTDSSRASPQRTFILSSNQVGVYSPPRLQHFGGGELSSINVSSIDKTHEKSLMYDIAGFRANHIKQHQQHHQHIKGSPFHFETTPEPQMASDNAKQLVEVLMFDQKLQPGKRVKKVTAPPTTRLQRLSTKIGTTRF